jgi:hypothetical protein
MSDLQRLSVSSSELVLPFTHAITALELLEAAEAPLLGWEGWLRYPSGRLGHSARHQGVDTSKLESSEAYRRVRSDICLSQKEHESEAAMVGIQLLFCITVNG